MATNDTHPSVPTRFDHNGRHVRVVHRSFGRLARALLTDQKDHCVDRCCDQVETGEHEKERSRCSSRVDRGGHDQTHTSACNERRSDEHVRERVPT